MANKNHNNSLLTIMVFIFFVSFYCFSSCKEKSDSKLSEVGKVRAVFYDSSVVTLFSYQQSKDGQSITLFFNERQEVFNLEKSEKQFLKFNKLFEDAFKFKSPLFIVTANGKIHNVEQPSGYELENYQALRRSINTDVKLKSIDLSVVDSNELNTVGPFNDWPAISRGCNQSVTLATAEAIFRYCENQLCPADGGLPPCIPFQYRTDGCHARAHRMNFLIETAYNVCALKIFSFSAHTQGKRLSVINTKWASSPICCTSWWWHCATLLLVSDNGDVPHYYVIDPSLFNQPVTITTWLSVQQHPCYPEPGVGSYSIQPFSSYIPNLTEGFYYTDPLYKHTTATLLNYATLNNCN